MPIALIHGVSAIGKIEPIQVQNVNTENAFYCDAPSITAAAGFVGLLAELEGLALTKKGKIRRGIDTAAGMGFSLFIHDYDRNNGKVAFNSGTENYVDTKDKLLNPPVPLETYMANMSLSLVLNYNGTLPSDTSNLDKLLNARTRRFNGGAILNDIMITEINSKTLKDHLLRYPAYQVLDRSDLKLSDWDAILDYIAFFEDPQTKRKTLRHHKGVYYAHQTGYQLLETPQQRDGALLHNNEACDHAFCEPIINLAELKHSTHLHSFADLHYWQWQENTQQQRVYLSTKNH